MLRKISSAVVILIAALLVFAAARHDTFRVERSASIKAQPEKIFHLINDFHQWDAWTPFNKDPAMKKTFSGAASGVGAISAWEGNSDVGQGSIQITESTPPAKIVMDLNIIKPFKGHNRVEFTLQPTADATAVTWAMNGTNTYLCKLMGIFISMDKMVGKDFGAGLSNLKNVAEK
jgi:uncharacterized protein YndB with AHSA1/START domain